MENVKPVHKITLRDIVNNYAKYGGLSKGLVKLPGPQYITILKRKCLVPETSEEFSRNICYGQRLFFMREEKNDIGVILRVLGGYFYSEITNEKWDADKALLIGEKVLTCKAIEAYPAAMHIIELIDSLAERENKLLRREPSKTELAAGIDRLTPYAELINIDFLRDSMKVTIPEVLLTSYNECLVRFMVAKERSDYQERLTEILTNEAKSKLK